MMPSTTAGFSALGLCYQVWQAGVKHLLYDVCLADNKSSEAQLQPRDWIVQLLLKDPRSLQMWPQLKC